MLKIPSGLAVCYSGYRSGQSPATRHYPSTAEIREDLRILSGRWRHLRLYDCSPHAERVLEVIRADKLDFQVMLGAYLGPEMNNFGCPWGTVYTEAELAAARAENDAEIERLVLLAGRYRDLVWSVAVGNEATVEWTDHFVPVPRMIELVRRVRPRVAQPVTVCENYEPWRTHLADLAAELDFLSLHTYPVWEYKQVHEAIHYTMDNYRSVARLYPDKPVVITEAGWATVSNGRGIDPGNSSEDLQAVYFADLMAWTLDEGILTYVFEAFDEPWKGSPDPLEPEKHWGLFTVERRPKKAVRDWFQIR